MKQVLLSWLMLFSIVISTIAIYIFVNGVLTTPFSIINLLNIFLIFAVHEKAINLLVGYYKNNE